MTRRPFLRVLVAAWALVGCAPVAFSQAMAQLNGTVADERGGVVARASITLRETDTNRAYTATTNDDGLYVIPNVPPGRYELKVAFTGFATFTQTGIELTVGQ